MTDPGPDKLFGVSAEYASAERLLAAVHEVSREGYTKVEAYTPFPMEDVSTVLGHSDKPVALVFLICGILGGLTGFGMCWYANVVNYPLDIGGRPHNSWPAWIPITFELTVLFAAVTGAIAMLVMCGLPRLHHPMFDAPNFERATRDRFFLCIEARDPKFNPSDVTTFLKRTGALSVAEVNA